MRFLHFATRIYIAVTSNHLYLKQYYYLLPPIILLLQKKNRVLASEHACARAQRLFYFFGKKLIICIYYNFGLLHFPITKKLRGVMKNYFSCKLIILVGLRAQIIYWALGLVWERGWSEEERMVNNGSSSGFNEQDANRKIIREGISPRIR